eukprot:20220-Heterococcus_DN1.PRE.2
MASATPRANNIKAAGIASARFSSPLADLQQQSLQQLKPDGSSTPKAAPLLVLYQDDSFCVVAKPTPMHVHRPDFGSTDTTFVLQKARDQLSKRIHTPHRLDRGTSGCLVLAFSGDAAKVLHQALESNTATKDDKGTERNATTDFHFYTGSSDPIARSSLIIAQPATGRWHQVTLLAVSIQCTSTSWQHANALPVAKGLSHCIVTS